jgi:hypothetical protein
MCNDNWTAPPIPVLAAELVNNSDSKNGFQRLFFTRYFARLSMYVMRMQRFDFWTRNNCVYEYIVQSVVLRHGS